MKIKSVSKRFYIILAAALLLLAGAVWLNLKLEKEDPVEGELPSASPSSEPGAKETMVSVYCDYFNSFRTERSRTRAQEIDYLRSILNSENIDEESIAEAQGRLLTLVGNMEKEFTIESRIRSKGFLDAAATIRDDQATVVIDGGALTDEEVARILDIVMSETGLPASAVKISLGE